MRLLYLSAIFLALPALAEPACQVHHYAPPNEAEQQLYTPGPAGPAAAMFEKLLAEKPNDPTLVAGSVLASLRMGNVDAASALVHQALAAHPNDAMLLVAKGNVDYRMGNIFDADRSYAAANHADPCLGLGYFGEYRVARISGMHASAGKLLSTAHALDPQQPQIAAAWARTQSPAENLAALKRALEETTNEDDRDRMQRQIDEATEAAQFAGRTCHVDAPKGHVTIPFIALMDNPNHISTWGLETGINGRTARLVLDSGAVGIYLSRTRAEAMGLKPISKSMVSGFGDHGPQSGYTALAETVKVGPLTFHDCRVEVSDRRSVVDRDGLIGTNIFSQFLIALDYPAHKMELSPLPGEGSSEAISADPDEDAVPHVSAPLTDRQSLPELAGYSPVYTIAGHLFMPTQINGKLSRLFMLDTGDAFINMSLATARDAGLHTHADAFEEDQMYGVSGKVAKLYSGPGVELRFGNAKTSTTDIAVVSGDRESRYFGVEVGGYIGQPALRFMTVHIDYRDSMVKFDYDPRNDHRDHRLDFENKACATMGQCQD